MEKVEEQKNKKLILKDDCPICFQLFVDPLILPCKHLFKVCIENILNTQTIKGNNCPVCRHDILQKFNDLLVDKDAQASFSDEERSIFIKHIKTLEKIK